MSAREPDGGFSDILSYWASAAESRPCLRFTDLAGRTESLSYGQLYDQVQRTAGGLAEKGIRGGDRCIIHTGNSIGFVLVFWALQTLGAVAVPTITQYAPDEFRYVAEHCHAKMVVSAPDLLETARAATDGLSCEHVVDDIWGDPVPAGVRRLSDLVKHSRPDVTVDAPGVHDVSVILYTSGTTSRPKGVMLSQTAALYTAECYAQHMRLGPADTVLTCMPLFHVNGMFLQMAPTLLSGATLALTPRFSARQYWKWVELHSATVLHLVAGPVRLLLAAPPNSDPALHTVRAMTFALPLTDAEIIAFETRFKMPLSMVWGLTETCCGGTFMPLSFGRRPGYQQIGPAMIGWDVRVADPGSVEVVPDGDIGELLVRSPGVMLGYFDDPDATERALQHGWVRSGDLGTRDRDGYFHFVDRIKDMLKPSGENVAASEIEEVILTHPGVAECAVIGIPDPVRTETVVAIVVPVARATVAAVELQAFCRARLAAFKVPSVIEVRAQLPKTSIGKIRKAELRLELSRRVV